MTIATLTGHAVLAVGPYSSIMDNGPAKAAGTAGQVQAAGDRFVLQTTMSVNNRASDECFQSWRRPLLGPILCIVTMGLTPI